MKSKIETMRLKYSNEVIKNLKGHPLMEYYFGLRLQRFVKLSSNTRRNFKDICSPMHQGFRKIIQKHKNLVGKENPNKQIIPKLEKPLYEKKTKLLYRYSIVKAEQAFKTLNETKANNRVKEVTYRLLYNMTPIIPQQKCPFCTEK